VKTKFVHALQLTLILLYALVMGASAVLKSLDMGSFLRVLGRLYPGWSHEAYWIGAALLIGLELAVAVALWVPGIRVEAAWVLTGLAWIFVLVHVRILLFFPQTNCNCFGRLFNRPPGLRTMSENVAFLLGALLLLVVSRRQRQAVRVSP
jgi:hypothetical protein